MNLKKYQEKFPFEYCASRYLHQWLTREQQLHQVMSSKPDGSDILQSLTYFKVSRNFAGLGGEPGQVDKIKKSLQLVKKSQRCPSPHSKVTELANRFQAVFGTFNLSAASKLFWLTDRSPYVVYDRRAVKALTRQLGQSLQNPRDYEEYTFVWRTEYNNAKTNIAAAIRKLPSGRAFMPFTSLTDAALRQLANEDWFKERVFDIFLWEIGGVNHDS